MITGTAENPRPSAGGRWHLLSAFLRGLGGLLLPQRCIQCAATVPEPGGLCAACWRGLTFLDSQVCQRCGLPFESEADMGEGALCLSCIARPPVYDRALAAAAYDDASRALVLALKHADRTDTAPALAGWLARAGAPLKADCDLIVPVPLHRRRLWRRRYNQAALLAGLLAATWDKPWDGNLLLRVRATPRQGRLSPAGRRRNMQGAFAVTSRAATQIKGKRILLVDDVLTTGATAEACARTLKKAGAAAVFLLTLARVARPRPL